MAIPLNMAFAEQEEHSLNNFGGIGLLDMRTARFAPDGTLALGVHYDNVTTRYFTTWQATPWLETTLSYSDENQDGLGVDRSLDVKVRLLSEGKYRPQVAFGIQDALGTKGRSAEYLVASKKYYSFDFTMGFAWGYLGSRGGIGNMFKLFGNSFDQRSSTASSGGVRSGSYFAGKDMSFYAGAEYHLPFKGLSFKVEYSGVDTNKIAEFSYQKQKSAFNMGMNYKPTSWADVALGFDQGERFTVRLILKQNLKKIKFKKWYGETKPTLILARNEKKPVNGSEPVIPSSFKKNNLIFNRLKFLEVSVIEIEENKEKMTISIQKNRGSEVDDLTLLGAILESYDDVTLIINNSENEPSSQKYDAKKSSIIGQSAVSKFRETSAYFREKTNDEENISFNPKIAKSAYDKLSKANLNPLSVSFEKQHAHVKKQAGPDLVEVKNIGRVARILTREMPDHVEEFTITTEDDGLKISQVSILRQDLEKANIFQGSPEEIWANSKISAPGSDELTENETIYSPYGGTKFNLGVMPEILTHFGGESDERFRADLYVKLFGSINMGKNIKLSVDLKQYIIGDIDKIPAAANENIADVRSSIARYAKDGRTALERVKLDYNYQLGKHIYARVSGGLLESMFGGVGAEVIYRPYEKNFALGLDLNWVKQRDFNQLFSFRDYNTVTGHATFYHENDTYHITSKLSAGRYLAGDYGATIDISRRFVNGIKLGVWATYTDMSSQDFGEGSFDKGIYLTMPLDIFWVQQSRKKMRFNFHSLGKNGGQRLNKRDNLYDILSSGRKSRLVDDWQQILD